MHNFSKFGKYNNNKSNYYILGDVMQLNKLDNIVFLKELESNIIDQAFIVLKDNVNFEKLKNHPNKSIDDKKTILGEAEILVNNELEINNLKFEEYKFQKLSKKYKFLKIVNITLISIIIFITFIK